MGRARVTQGHRIMAALGLALLGTGCASKQSVVDLQTQVQRLQAENVQLRRDLTEARVRMRMAGVAVPEGAAPGASAPAPGRSASAPALSDILAPIPQAEIRSEEISASETDAMRSRAPARAVSIGGGAESPESMMQAAHDQLERREHEGALAGFQEVVRRYPESEVADDALQGAGDAYFQMGRYDEAIQQYRAVAEQFPHSDRVPWAFLQIGFAHLRMGQKDQAVDDFRTVSQAYPGTEAATVARQQIAHLRAKPR
jgi:tol-pal system protein YbgF